MMKKIMLVVLMLLVASTSYANEIDLKINDASVREAAVVIAAKGQVHVIVDENVDASQKISMNFTEITPMQALMLLTSTRGLAVSWDGKVTYLISKLSKESSTVLRNASSQNSPSPQKTFQYKYPLGSPVLLKNVSIDKVLLAIATSCNVGITSTLDVNQSEIIQQIDIPQMTPDVAFAALAKATGLTVIKIQEDRYLVTRGTADTDKKFFRRDPTPPRNPWEHLWPYFIEPLSSR